MKGESKRKIKSKDDAKVLALVVRKQEMGKSAGRLGFRGRDWEFSSAHVELSKWRREYARVAYLNVKLGKES